MKRENIQSKSKHPEFVLTYLNPRIIFWKIKVFQSSPVCAHSMKMPFFMLFITFLSQISQILNRAGTDWFSASCGPERSASFCHAGQQYYQRWHTPLSSISVIAQSSGKEDKNLSINAHIKWCIFAPVTNTELLDIKIRDERVSAAQVPEESITYLTHSGRRLFVDTHFVLTCQSTL